jgi:hypothetical protein
MTAQAVAQPWHGIVDEAVTEGLHRQQIVDRVLAVFPNLTRPQIDGRISRRRQLQRLTDNLTASQWESKVQGHVDEVRAQNDRCAWATPVEVPRLAPTPITSQASSTVIVYSDTHFGHECEETLAILYECARQLKPAGMIANGDVSNLGGMGKYAQSGRPTTTTSLREEQRRTKSHWLTLGEIGQSWGMWHAQNNANHDGDSEESRWERWISDRLGADFLALDGAEQIKYSRYFHHPDVPVSMHDEIVLPGALRVRHGRLVRKSGGQSARGHGHDQLLGNILIGHTHRQGYSPKRRPELTGVYGEGVMKMWEGGCCCRIAGYAPDADWVRGFSIVHIDEANDCNQVELITVENGRAVVPSLGRTVIAA